MQKTCTTCSLPFEITDEELQFLQKVSPTFSGKTYTIPPPSLCPQCRVQRRMAWRNDRTFHKRTSSLSGKEMVSLYPEGTPFPVYHTDEWWSDQWNPMDYGREYDLSRPFFDQWRDLMNAVPRRNMDLINCENSQYCNYCGDDKNCYLDIAGEGNEDCFYNLFTKYSTNCVDCTFTYKSTLCYETIQCYNSYGCRNSMYLEDCSDCAFCFDLKGCKNCLLSTNLRNKEYYILNEPHSKEEYEKKVLELNLGSYQALQSVHELWEKMRIEKGLYRDMYILNCENCTGNNIQNSQNCLHAFNAVDCRDCRHLYDVMEATDCQDMNYSLYKPEVSYEMISTLNLRYSAFCMATHYSNNLFYCDLTENSSNCFGCIGLNHGEYCILNKQYSKDEYGALVPRIIENMQNTPYKNSGPGPGPDPIMEWGQFFPMHISPFPYEETVAQEYMPSTTDEGNKENIEPGPGPDHISDVDESICETPLTCEATGKQFKLIPQEVAFYKQQGIPVPHLCPDERHRRRLARRNPRTLHARTCSTCSKEIETTYSPERPERVVCEECYLKEVY